jgi:hypothetical protein
LDGAGGSVSTANLFISTSNLIGVGTTNPSANLQVTGNLYVSNAISTGNIFGNGFGIYNLNSSNLLGTISSVLIFGNTISNVNSANISQPFANLIASNTVTTTNVVAAGFTSNSTNTIFNYSTLNVPIVVAGTLSATGQSNLATLNVSSTANIAAANVTTLRTTGQSTLATLNVSGTSNLTSVVSSGQIVATGKTGVGVCPPIVYRQGGSATNWNAPGSNTSPNVYAITSGAVQIQCGANVMTGTTQFIPFPVAYTNNPTVLVTSYSTTGNIWVASITSTAFSVSANVALQFEWLSIGI